MNPSLINQWDPGFYKEISEVLHQQLQHLSGHAVATHTMVLLPSEHSYSWLHVYFLILYSDSIWFFKTVNSKFLLFLSIVRLLFEAKFIDNFGDREVNVSLKRRIEQQVSSKHIGQAAVQLIIQKLWGVRSRVIFLLIKFEYWLAHQINGDIWCKGFVISFEKNTLEWFVNSMKKPFALVK